MAKNLTQLLMEAKQELMLSNGKFAELAGMSQRSWERHGTLGRVEQSHGIIRALLPVNPSLANELALAAGTSLHDLGLASTTRESLNAERVVGVLAKGLGVSTNSARPVLADALQRASELGATFQELIAELRKNQI